MAGRISENYESRRFDSGLTQTQRELVFDIQDTADEAEVEALILGQAPAVYRGLVLDSTAAEVIGVDSVTGMGIWKGYARYKNQEIEYTFDTGGGTQKITQSYATINTYAPPGETAPDFGGAIGVSEDSVEGVDIPIPKFDFTETHTFPDVNVSNAYKLTLFRLTGRRNDADFKGFSAGECLFQGVTGSNRGTGQWTLTFRFSASPNVEGLSLGTITGIDKLGWDYLWIRYGDYADMAAASVVKRPISAYVERVILPGDLSLLLIGV